MGGSISGNFGNTKGSSLDALSNMLTAASLIPGIDTLAPSFNELVESHSLSGNC